MSFSEEIKEHFWLRDPGLSVTFLSYSDENGTPLTPPPVTDHGNGWYSFDYGPVGATRLYAVSASNGAIAHGKIQRDQLTVSEKQDISDIISQASVDSVWNAPEGSYNNPSTMGNILHLASGWAKIAAGEAIGTRKIENNQLKIYSGVDGSLLATFNLFGEDGTPDSFDIFHREKL